jgi:hypothetical protein
MNNNQTVIAQHIPTITIEAMKKSAASNIPWEDQLSELVDNAILKDKNKCVDVVINMYYDDNPDNSFIEVRDNSIGIPADKILDVFNLGSRVNTEYFLLGKMGMGLKGAVWSIGELDYVVSKTESGEKAEVRAKPYANLNEMLVYHRVENNDNLLEAQKSGTIVRIKRVNDYLPKWTSKAHFDKFVDRYNSMYAHLLYENRVRISIYYTNGSYSNVRFDAHCHGSFPLMSNPRHVLDSDPSVGTLGHNECIYIQGTQDKIENIPIVTANISAKLSAWHKPTPAQVEWYHNKTKNSAYEPEQYKNSVFGYGRDRAGITVMYKGKIIAFGLEKESSRETNKGILLEIDDDSGLKFTKYKNTLIQNNNYRECMDEVRKFLEEAGFLIRTSNLKAQAVAEEEIVDKFIEYIRHDKIYKKDFGIVDFDEQVKTWVRTEVGEADIVIYDYHDKNKVNVVIEAKKDFCGGEQARQLWGYMCDLDCTRGILLSGVPEEPTFTAQVKAFKKHHVGFTMEHADVDSLFSANFFK